MANNERLTKRLKKIEEWVAENEDMGGPKGYLDTFVQMYNMNGTLSNQARQMQSAFEQLKALTFGFMQENKLEKEWDTYFQEKENAVQEQQAEEVPLQEEAKSGEETLEAPKKEIRD